MSKWSIALVACLSTTAAAQTEVSKLNLTREQRQQQIKDLETNIAPPGFYVKLPPDDAEYADSLIRLFGVMMGKETAPFYGVEVKPAWGGAQGDFLANQLDLGRRSELLHLGEVYLCLPRDASGKLVVNLTDKRAVAVFAVCHNDMKFDTAALDQELADPRFNDLARAKAHDLLAKVQADVATLTAAYQQQANQDADFKAVVFDASEKAWADWQASYAAHQADVDAAHALVHKLLADLPGVGKVNNAGCDETTHKPLVAYVQSQKPKTPEDVLKLAADNVGWPLLEAATLCDAYEGRLAQAHGEAWMLEHGGEHSGPRTATASALVALVQQRAAAKQTTPFGANDLLASSKDYVNTRSYIQNSLGKSDEDYTLVIDGNAGGAANRIFYKAVLASTKKTKDGVELDFKNETWTVPDWDCVKSRIINWEIDGTPIWDYDCKPATPPSHVESNTHEAVIMSPWIGPSLKGGQLVQVMEYVRKADNVPTAFPVAVWANKSMAKLVIAYGIPLQP